MWHHYRCDRCGRIIYVDAGERRLCDRCLATEKGDRENDIREESGDHDGGSQRCGPSSGGTGTTDP